MSSKKGFTLVELLGVLVVLGLISVIIVPKVIDSITTSKEAAYQTQVETIENAAKKYGISNDLLYPKEGEKKYIAVKDLIAVGELSDKEIINPKTGNKMNGYVLVEYNSGYQQYEYTYVEEIDENTLGAMGPTYEVKDPDKWTTSKNVTIIYPKGNGKYEYEFIFKGIVEIGGQEYNYTEQDWKDAKKWIATPELRKNITFKTKGSLIARVKNKDEYIYGSTLEIVKIDNTAPSAKLGYDKNTTNKIDLVATCSDNESGISKYLFKLGNGNWIDNGTSNKYTFSNLNDSTSYDFSVECINGVGMTNQSTLNSTTSEIGAPTFIVSNPGKWETNKNVTISYPENYTRYEFSIIDGTATRNGQELTPGTWYIASSLEEVVNFTTEGTIVARVYDGTNLKYAVNQAITYVDPTKPTCEILLTGGTLGTNGYYTVAPKVQFKTSIAGGSGIYFGQSKTNIPEYDNSVTKNNFGLINITDVNSDGNNTYYGFVKTGVIDKNVTSTCSKTFKVDTTKPVVAINGNASVSYANSSTTITIPLKVTDLTSGIDTNTFTDSDITVKVGTTTVTPTKSLKYNSVSNGVYSYTLTLSGVTGNGALNLSVGAGMVVDKAGNKNNTASISTNVIIDNTAPTLEITGTNGTTYKKESDATITLKDTGGSGLTAGSYTIKYGWATSSQTCSNLTSSTTITVAAGATSGSVKVNVKGKTGAGKLYVCNSTSITDRAKNTLSANSVVSSNMYLDNQGPKIVIDPNGGSYTIPVGSTSTTVAKTVTVTDLDVNKSSLKYGWSSSKDVKPTMSSSFTSGTSFNDSLSGGDNYLWITASDNSLNTTTIVSNSFNVGYSVEYNANGGTTTCSAQRKEHGKNLTLCSTKPTRSGYTFAGWSDSSTATSKKYDASGTYTNNSSVKLYAVWKRTTTVTAATKSKVYDGTALTSNECSASDLLAPDHKVTCTNSGTITDVGSVANSVNTVKITDSNGNDVTDNYSVTKANGTLTVDPKSVAVTWEGPTEFTYNGKAQAPTASVATGISNEEMRVERTTETNAGSYTSTASCSEVKGGQAKCSNYTLTGNKKEYEIIKASSTNPTITAYEGTYDAASHTFTMSGGSGGTIQYSTDSGKTWDTNKPTRTDEGTTTVQVKVVGDKNHNNTTAISTKIKINERATTVTAASTSKTYDGKALTKTSGCASSTNLVSGHTATCTNSGTRTDAGSATNTLSTVVIKDTKGTDVTKNYAITKKNGTLTVDPKSVAVTWEGPTEFTYNGKAQAPTASVATGISNEEMRVERTTETNAGSYTSTASCSEVKGGQAKCSNYTLTGNKKEYEIIKASSTNPTITAYEGTYDAASHTFTMSGGSGGTIQYSTDSGKTWDTNKPTRTDEGTTTVQVKVVGDKNHNNTTAISTKIKINERATTVTAASTSKTYDGKALTKTSGCASSTNLVSGHTATCTNSGTRTDAGSATNTLSTVVIKDTKGTDVTKNYAITKKNGTLTVDPKSVAVTWNSKTTFTYTSGKQGPTLSKLTETGVNGEIVHMAVTKNPLAVNVGSYTAEAGCVHVSKGQESKSCDNYTLTGNTKEYEITKASSTNPTLTAYEGTYDENSHSFTISGGAGGTIKYSTDDGKTWTTTQPTRTNAGTTTVKVKVFGDDNHNDTSAISTTIKINKATPIIKLSATSAWLSGSKTFTEKANVAGTFTNKSGNENVATVSPKSITNVPKDTAKTVTVTGVADGSSTITVNFEPTDTTNYNDAVAKTYTAKVDKTRPTITANGYAYSNKNGSHDSTTYNDTGSGSIIKQHVSAAATSSDTYDWNNTGINFHVAFSDSNSGIKSAEWCWNDSGKYTTNTETNKCSNAINYKQIELVAAGYRKGTFTVEDNAGNTTVYNVVVKIDKTPPALVSGITKMNSFADGYEAASADAWTDGSTSLQWSFKESYSGIDKVQYKLNDDTTWSTASGYSENLIEDNGSKTYEYEMIRSNKRDDKISIRVVDKAGNISTEISSRLRIGTSVAKPTTSSCISRTYNGTSQTLANAGTGYTLSGNKQTNANENGYTITAKVNNKSSNYYIWKDMTTNDVTFKCALKKATPTLTLGKNKEWHFNSTNNVPVKASVAGTVKIKSSDSSYVGVYKDATPYFPQESYSLSLKANTSENFILFAMQAEKYAEKKVTVDFTPTDTTNYKPISTSFTAKADRSSPIISVFGDDSNYYTSRLNCNWLTTIVFKDEGVGSIYIYDSTKTDGKGTQIENARASAEVMGLLNRTVKSSFSIKSYDGKTNTNVSKDFTLGFNCSASGNSNSPCRNFSNYKEINHYFGIYIRTSYVPGQANYTIPKNVIIDGAGNKNIKKTYYGFRYDSSNTSKNCSS